MSTIVEATHVAAPKIRQTGILIGDEFRSSVSGKTFKTFNPATEEVICEVAEGDAADVDLAVHAARAAFETGPWSRMDARDRGRLLHKLADLAEQHLDELAALETLDNGKPINDSRAADLPLAIDCLRYYAGWADKIHGDTIPIRGDYFCYTRREPIGVCGQIIPWNFPLLMVAWKWGPALATGNTIVMKPAEQTPLSCLRLAELALEAGFPPGVINVVPGYGPTAGAALVKHPQVDKIAFTGSTEVGKAIATSVAGTGTKLTLELGGKSPNIVFADAALDQAVEGVVSGIWFNQGHVCCAGSRLFLEESIHDDFIERLKARMKMLRVGDPLDKNTDVGAINSKSQLEVINRFVNAGSAEGAQKFEVSCDLPKKGFWCRPALFTGVQPSHTIAREEIFGPVLSVMTFRTPEEAVQRANNTTYGLSAGVWTEKAARALEMSNRLSAGVVWLNTFNRFDATAPFGGYRESGFGREGGRQGLMSYVKLANAKKKTGGKR